MASKMFSGEQKAKLTQLVNEGIAVLQEVEDLTAGLNDTVKAVAEERAEAEAKEKAKEKAKAKDSETGIRRELGSRPSRTIAQLIRKESADHGHSD